MSDLEEYVLFEENSSKLAPYSVTPMEVVEKMLELAGTKRDDVVYDLGSGDGRIVITAARKYGARAVGLEIDPRFVRKSRDNAREAGVEDRVEIRQQDIMTADFSRATVVTLYLVPKSNLRLRPILRRQLKPGARVVSHEYDMGDWEPDAVEEVLDNKGYRYTIYLWRIKREDAD